MRRSTVAVRRSAFTSIRPRAHGSRTMGLDTRARVSANVGQGINALAEKPDPIASPFYVGEGDARRVLEAR